MNSQELRALQEAYSQVYELDEEERPLPVDKMRGQMFAHKVRSNDTKNVSRSMRYHTRANRIDDTLSGKRKPQVSRGKYAEKEKDGNRFPNRLTRSDKQGIKDSYEYDLYDIILSHLLDEGYADTEQAAEAIMVNMSEDWRESIVEGAAGAFVPSKVDDSNNRRDMLKNRYGQDVSPRIPGPSGGGQFEKSSSNPAGVLRLAKTSSKSDTKTA